MDINRRDFIVLPGAVMAESLLAEETAAPWHQKARRVGQVNMTERDVVDMKVEEWADYWASAKVDAVLVSVTGIVAFYPSKVPFHRPGQYLGNRDFFGECFAAAKKRGIRVVARMSPDLNWEEAVSAHPEWFQKDAQGNPQRHTEDRRLFRTCMFSTYFTDYMPAIMREINSRYDVDGHYTNGWPPLGRLPVCYCDQCKRLAPAGSPEYWEQFNERVVYLWKLYDGIAKEKRADSLFYANLGGGVRCTANLKQLAEVCHWFNCDNQGRGGDDTPIWGCTLQGRVCQATMKGRTSTNVTGMWSTGAVRWRNAAKSPAEATMWFDETVASGMVIWYSFIGAQTGMGGRPPLAGAGPRLLQLAGAPRPALRQPAHHRQPGRSDGTAHAPVLPAAGERHRAAVSRRALLRAARRPVPLRFRTRGRPGRREPEEILRAAAAQHRAAERRAVPPVAHLCGCGRLAAGHLRDQPVRRTESKARGVRAGGRVRHSEGRRNTGHGGQRVLRAHREAARDRERLHQHQLAAGRGIPRAGEAGGGRGADGGAGIRGLPAGAFVSAHAAHG
ncbi:hypothetical protein SBA4_2040022 [Candidatus Sulfopaludibacter sp. SbA4]|nr:hypothetical protein SBA4_2040022 [Candidatus Sulfopaludibacter sp. SbA4]